MPFDPRDPAQREEMKRLATAASPAPWSSRPAVVKMSHPLPPRPAAGIADADGMCLLATTEWDGDEVVSRPADAAFMVAARSAVPALLEEVERLTEELRKAREAAPPYPQGNGGCGGLAED